MDISYNSGYFYIQVVYYYSPTGRITWNMTGQLDEGVSVHYWNGICKDFSNGTESTRYTTGEGIINIIYSESNLYVSVKATHENRLPAGSKRACRSVNPLHRWGNTSIRPAVFCFLHSIYPDTDYDMGYKAY